MKLFKRFFTSFLILLITCSSGFSGIPEDLTEGGKAFRRKDYATAIKLLGPAENSSSGEALYYLGKMHRYGLGVPKNNEKAFTLFERGNALKEPFCQWELAKMYGNGRHVSQDIPKAESLIREAFANADEKKKKILTEWKKDLEPFVPRKERSRDPATSNGEAKDSRERSFLDNPANVIIPVFILFGLIFGVAAHFRAKADAAKLKETLMQLKKKGFKPVMGEYDLGPVSLPAINMPADEGMSYLIWNRMASSGSGSMALPRTFGDKFSLIFKNPTLSGKLHFFVMESGFLSLVYKGYKQIDIPFTAAGAKMTCALFETGPQDSEALREMISGQLGESITAFVKATKSLFQNNWVRVYVYEDELICECVNLAINSNIFTPPSIVNVVGVCRNIYGSFLKATKEAM